MFLSYTKKLPGFIIIIEHKIFSRKLQFFLLLLLLKNPYICYAYLEKRYGCV